ncbi:hypothetical protein OOT46_27810 [Aquabacterium sp. A7-Y]|uniref:hypothetical protein n=1 Tax=Aquabacterium sp. A7-Y TaxID=1349605 RepID=UPI00223E7D10|nr:hypothetical protein [Aquabacterium sp. A7-Y]MCW7541614.1 hypothetical protein [Aquabacterium sp. A7-Y]
MESPVGALPALKPPGLNDRLEYRMDPIPALGEHNRSIFRELGLDEADVGDGPYAGGFREDMVP